MKKKILDFLINNKAKDVYIFTSKKNHMFDYIIICTVLSQQHLKTLSKKVSLTFNAKNRKLIEGINTNWAIVDLDSIVIHIMSSKERIKYNLEEEYNKNKKD